MIGISEAMKSDSKFFDQCSRSDMLLAAMDLIEELQKWYPISEAHEDFGDCVFINVNDPGNPVCSNVCCLDFNDNLKYYEWTHFQPIRLSHETADKLIREMGNDSN